MPPVRHFVAIINCIWAFNDFRIIKGTWWCTATGQYNAYTLVNRIVRTKEWLGQNIVRRHEKEVYIRTLLDRGDQGYIYGRALLWLGSLKKTWFLECYKKFGNKSLAREDPSFWARTWWRNVSIWLIVWAFCKMALCRLWGHLPTSKANFVTGSFLNFSSGTMMKNSRVI